MKKRSLISISLILVLCISLFAGCGAGKDMAADTVASAPAKSESYSYYDTPAEAPMPEPEMEYGYLEEAAPVTPTDSAADKSSNSLGNAKLIYSAGISLETTEFDAAVEGLNSLTSDMGGYFESSYVGNEGSYRVGSYTVRIPAENFESFCDAVGALCTLRHISRSAQDVSEAYYDLESRLATQETKLERLQELLARAESMEDIITIESAISDTELQIEQLTGSLRKYDSLVGFSTVNIDIDEVYKVTQTEEPVIGFGAKLASAFRSGCSSFVNSLERLALNFAYNWVGWLIFLAVVAVAAVLGVRAGRKAKARMLARRSPVEKKASENKPDEK